MAQSLYFGASFLFDMASAVISNRKNQQRSTHLFSTVTATNGELENQSIKFAIWMLLIPTRKKLEPIFIQAI